MKASDAIRELMRPPYADSSIESLYETLQCRLEVILPAIEAAEKLAQTVEEHLERLGYPYHPASRSRIAKALKAYKEASHAS